MMKQAAWILVAIACAGSLAAAKPKAKQQPPAKPAAADVEAELAKLREAWGKALQAQDKAAMLALTKKTYALQLKATGAGSPEAEDLKERLAMESLDAGEHSAAEKLLLEIVATRSKQKLERSYELIGPLDGLLRIYEVQGRQAEMEPLWTKKLAVTKQLDGEKSDTYANQLSHRAWMFIARSDYPSAIRSLEESLAVYDAMSAKDKNANVSQTLAQVAPLYMQTNQPAKGIAAYDRMLQLVEKDASMSPLNKMTLMWGTGGSYFRAGRKDLGFKVFDRAIALGVREAARLEKAEPDNTFLVDIYSELALFYMHRGDLPKAEQASKRALALTKKRGTPGAAQGALIEYLRTQGRPKDALALAVQAQAAMPSSVQHLPSFYDSVAADVQRELGDTKAAVKLIDKFVAGNARTYGKTSPYHVSAALQAVGIHAAGGDLKKAEQVLSGTLELAETAQIMALRTGTDADHASYAAQSTKVLDTALTFNAMFAPKSASAARLGLTTLLRRKGRIIDASAAALATIRGKLSPDDKRLLDELLAARARLAKQSVAGAGASRAKDIAALEELVQRLEAEVSKKSAAYRKVTQPIELAAIQKQIPKDTRLVEIANYEPLDPRRPFAKFAAQPHLPRRYLAYVLGGTGDAQLVDLGEAAPIDAAIETLRKALADPDNDQAAQLGKALYGLTIGKIVPKLGGATNVLIAPDGALNVIPFSALVDDKKQFLIATYTFTYLTSGRDLLRLTVKTKAEGGGVLFADPSFDATTAPTGGGKAKSRGVRSLDLASLQWPRLAGTAAEADAIGKAFRGLKVFRADAATEGALKKVKGPRILHLATHGFFLPDDHPETAPGVFASPPPTENPMLRSGLAFAGANKLSSGEDDGLLTALEASGLDLEGTKLVVLSACETGVGKVTNGDGVYGLRRSLVIAGAESLVMSMWQVDDFATKDLMAGFYKKLAAGTPRSAALRETQLELLSKPKYAHPFYWAAFLPAGATTPLKD